MGEPRLDHVLDSLRSRLTAFEDTGDPSGLFSDAATEEAALLIDAVRERTSAGLDDAWDDAALATAGRLHWKRHLTVPPSDTVHDEAALVLFIRPFRSDRSLVPEVVWSHLAGQTDDADRLSLVELPAEEIARVAESAAGRGLAPALVLPLRVADAMLPGRHPGSAPVLSALAIVHHALHGSGDDGALDAAIEAADRAAAAGPDDWPGRAVLLSRLGMFLWERYNRDGDEADLTASETANRDAVRACGEAGPARPGCLHNLVLALLSRYELGHEPAVLAEAVETGREAARTTDPAHQVAPLHALSLSAALRLDFDRTGDPAATAEAERALTAALAGAAADNPYRPMVWARLGDLPHGRFDRDGDEADREAALGWYRKVLDAVPEGEPLHADVAEAVAALSGDPRPPEAPRRPEAPRERRGRRRWRWTRAG
ncbi:hypothetical protein [Nonomuraea sp. NPDC005650]|uniref:hypothetical protein n=1 Tax=Nonomuraea sp. NPDC005650 TaxID=3157045 RepID=UPI00339DBE00